MDATISNKQEERSKPRRSLLLRLAVFLVFALLILAGGAWLHSLSITQHAYLNMPPYIVAALVTDVGMVLQLAGLLTWIIGGIFLVSLIVHWFREDFTP